MIQEICLDMLKLYPERIFVCAQKFHLAKKGAESFA